MHINPLNDTENIRQQRNLTNSQKRNVINTKEGVLVNNLVKEKDYNLNDTKDTFIISEDVPLPKDLYKNDNQIIDKRLVPLSAIALGVMSSVAILTKFMTHSAKISVGLAKEKWLPSVTRNVQLSNEMFQVIYQMVQNPNRKTFTAGAGVLALTAMTFMSKTFFDGYKDVWIKRKEADIQKNLQENLISVETKSFSGKIQIIRSMLSKYTNDFEKYLTPEDDRILPYFGKNRYMKQTFTAKEYKNNENKKSSSGIGNVILGLGTFAGIVGLGFLSLKNLSKSNLHLKNGINEIKTGINQIISTSSEATKDIDKNNLEHLFMSIDAKEDFIKEQVNKLNWANLEEKNEFIKKIISKIKTSTTQVNPNIGGDGTPKPAFNSFVDDYRAFFYNMLLDTSNPQLQQLFWGITGISAISYGGKLAGDAIKEIQVKKINAETELELQNRLVSTELRNFKSKKDAAILPLVEEFYKQVDSKTRTKEELKTMAENVLSEIKNGPPYVYS